MDACMSIRLMFPKPSRIYRRPPESPCPIEYVDAMCSSWPRDFHLIALLFLFSRLLCIAAR